MLTAFLFYIPVNKRQDNIDIKKNNILKPNETLTAHSVDQIIDNRC